MPKIWDSVDERRAYNRSRYHARKHDKNSSYSTTRQREYKRNRKAIMRREVLWKYKSNQGCQICGWNKHPVGLHLHHRDKTTKRKDVSSMFSNHTSYKIIAKEIKKCIVICANCHLMVTQAERHLKMEYKKVSKKDRKDHEKVMVWWLLWEYNNKYDKIVE